MLPIQLLISCECASKTETKEKKLMNKVTILFPLCTKSIVVASLKLRLKHWCHMDYFNNVLATFLGLNMVTPLLSMQHQKALRFHQKYLNLCSEDEQRSYEFGTTWGWVINDRIFIFRWTIPLRFYKNTLFFNTFIYRNEFKCNYI